MPRSRKRSVAPTPASWDSSAVRALRQGLGMSQEELARSLGVRQQTVSEWETGVYVPRGASAMMLGILAERAERPYRSGPPLPQDSPEEQGHG